MAITEQYDSTQLPKGPVWIRLWFGHLKHCDWVMSISKVRDQPEPDVMFRSARTVFFVPVSTETEEELEVKGLPRARMMAYGVVTNPSGKYFEVRKSTTQED